MPVDPAKERIIFPESKATSMGIKPNAKETSDHSLHPYMALYDSDSETVVENRSNISLRFETESLKEHDSTSPSSDYTSVGTLTPILSPTLSEAIHAHHYAVLAAPSATITTPNPPQHIKTDAQAFRSDALETFTSLDYDTRLVMIMMSLQLCPDMAVEAEKEDGLYSKWCDWCKAISEYYDPCHFEMYRLLTARATVFIHELQKSNSLNRMLPKCRLTEDFQKLMPRMH